MKNFLKTFSLIGIIVIFTVFCCSCTSTSDNEDDVLKTIEITKTIESTQTVQVTQTVQSTQTVQVTQTISASTYSQPDFEITMAPGFTESELATATYFYVSDDAALIIMKEEFTTLEQVIDLNADSTVIEYGEAVRANTQTETSEIMVDDSGITYFTYENNALGQDFFYTAVLCKGSDAFWLCTFYCMIEDKAEFENVFLNWGSTIKVA